MAIGWTLHEILFQCKYSRMSLPKISHHWVFFFWRGPHITDFAMVAVRLTGLSVRCFFLYKILEDKFREPPYFALGRGYTAALSISGGFAFRTVHFRRKEQESFI
jgi:hypothetical protein